MLCAEDSTEVPKWKHALLCLKMNFISIKISVRSNPPLELLAESGVGGALSVGAGGSGVAPAVHLSVQPVAHHAVVADHTLEEQK